MTLLLQNAEFRARVAPPRLRVPAKRAAALCAVVVRVSIGLVLATPSFVSSASGPVTDQAQSENESEFVVKRSPNVFVFGLGPSYWPGVHDIDPSGSPFADQLGRFHTWGFDLELAYQRRVTRKPRFDLLVGGDFGLAGHDNSADLEIIILPSGKTIGGTLTARTLYLTPSVRFVFAGEGRWRFSVGAGAGYYEVDYAELFDDGFEAAELFSASTFGGYLSIGVDRRLWAEQSRWQLRLEQKIHFADFGSTETYAAGGGDLEGPISTLLIGLAYH